MRQAGWDHPGERPSHALTALKPATAGLGLAATGTAVLAHLRRTVAGQWSMTWSNAGHPRPSCCAGRQHDAARGPRHPVRLPELRTGPRCDHGQVLEPGSTLFPYTDGLVECRGCDVDERIDRLRLLLAGLRGRQPAEMVDTAVEVLARRPGTTWSRSRST